MIVWLISENPRYRKQNQRDKTSLTRSPSNPSLQPSTHYLYCYSYIKLVVNLLQGQHNFQRSLEMKSDISLEDETCLMLTPVPSLPVSECDCRWEAAPEWLLTARPTNWNRSQTYLSPLPQQSLQEVSWSLMNPVMMIESDGGGFGCHVQTLSHGAAIQVWPSKFSCNGSQSVEFSSLGRQEVYRGIDNNYNYTDHLHVQHHQRTFSINYQFNFWCKMIKW